MLESSLQIGRRYLNDYYLGSFDIRAGCLTSEQLIGQMGFIFGISNEWNMIIFSALRASQAVTL